MQARLISDVLQKTSTSLTVQAAKQGSQAVSNLSKILILQPQINQGHPCVLGQSSRAPWAGFRKRLALKEDRDQQTAACCM